MTPAPSALGSDLANRILEGESWARDKLAAHAGRVFSITCGPVTAAFRITDAGILENASVAGGTPDLCLSVLTLRLPAYTADPRNWSQYIREDGDVALGGTLKELAQTLPW